MELFLCVCFWLVMFVAATPLVFKFGSRLFWFGLSIVYLIHLLLVIVVSPELLTVMCLTVGCVSMLVA
jgi:hypothetical protein